MNGKRPVAYICSPFSGDVQGNLRKARQYCREAVDKGYIPIAPHLLLPQFMREETERELAMEMDIEILRRCDVLLICGERISSGMEKEISFASGHGIRVLYLHDA